MCKFTRLLDKIRMLSPAAMLLHGNKDKPDPADRVVMGDNGHGGALGTPPSDYLSRAGDAFGRLPPRIIAPPGSGGRI